MSGNGKGYPAAQLADACSEGDFIADTIDGALVVGKGGKPETVEELHKRIERFFETCVSGKIRPGYEMLAAMLCVDRSTVWRWKRGQGCDSAWRDEIIRAASVIDAVLEQALLQGKVNPASGIFLAKNWLGYRDTISLEDASELQGDIERRRTPEEIARDHGITIDRMAAIEMPEEDVL